MTLPVLDNTLITAGGHFGRVLLLRRRRHRGPVGHPRQWASIQGKPLFTMVSPYMISPQLNLLNLTSNQQTLFLSKRTASLWAIPRQSWTCSTRSSSPSSLPSSSGGSRWPAYSKYSDFLVWILISQLTMSDSPTPIRFQAGWNQHISSISAGWLNSNNTFTKEVRLKARSMQKLQRKSSTVWRLPGKLVALNWGWVGRSRKTFCHSSLHQLI